MEELATSKCHGKLSLHSKSNYHLAKLYWLQILRKPQTPEYIMAIIDRLTFRRIAYQNIEEWKYQCCCPWGHTNITKCVQLFVQRNCCIIREIASERKRDKNRTYLRFPLFCAPRYSPPVKWRVIPNTRRAKPITTQCFSLSEWPWNWKNSKNKWSRKVYAKHNLPKSFTSPSNAEAHVQNALQLWWTELQIWNCSYKKMHRLRHVIYNYATQ